MKTISFEISDEDYIRLLATHPEGWDASEIVEIAVDDYIEDHELYIETKNAKEKQDAEGKAYELAHARVWNEGPVKIWPMFIGDLRYLTDDPDKEDWTMEQHINSALMNWITVSTHVYKGRADYAFELLKEFVPPQTEEV